MGSLVEPLRAAHYRLLFEAETIRETADMLEGVLGPELRHRIGGITAFLQARLLPELLAEARTIYPVVTSVLGAPLAATGMHRELVEISRLGMKLEALRPRLLHGYFGLAQQRMLRRLLYSLYAIIALHFARADEVYLPGLEKRLSEVESARLKEQFAAEVQRTRALAAVGVA